MQKYQSLQSSNDTNPSSLQVKKSASIKVEIFYVSVSF